MKRTFSFILTIVMVLGIFTSVPVTVSATSVDDLTFELSDDGTMYQVISYNGWFDDVVIPSKYNGLPVTRIAPGAFSESSINSVSIPDSVTSIGASAFHECGYLTTVTMPDSVTNIGDHAFYYCSSLESIKIPYGVTSIEEDTFSYCTSLTSITIPDSVTYIGSYAFENCRSLTSITIPDSVTSIGSSAFSVCTSLSSITIPDGVTSLGGFVFFGCEKLTSVTIGESVTSIGERAFWKCTSLKSIKFPDSLTNIDDEAFYGCTGLESIEISEGITSIDNDAFFGCLNLKSVTIPNNVTYIGNQAFGYKYSSWEEKNVKIDGFTIYGYKDSAAEKYAKDNGFEFIKIECEEHTLSNWIIDKEPTCTSDGIKHKACTVCGAVTADTVIPKIGHTASDWITDKKATVNTAGSKHKECIECGEILETATIKQLKCSKPKLKKIENTSSGVKITWGKVSGADKYYVYRKISGGSYSKIGTTTKTYYTDKTAKSGKKYYYIVKAINEAGSSSSSSSLSKLYLADPTLKTPSSTKSGVKLTWSKVSGADGYMVYRKTGSGSYSKIATVKGYKKVTYTDKSAKKGKKYTYKVKAYKSKTYSAYSNTKALTDKY